eukprot:796241_1
MRFCDHLSRNVCGAQALLKNVSSSRYYFEIMACCFGNKGDLENEEVFQDLEGAVDVTEHEGNEKGVEKSFQLSTLFGHYTNYVAIGVIGLLVVTAVLIGLYSSGKILTSKSDSDALVKAKAHAAAEKQISDALSERDILPAKVDALWEKKVDNLVLQMDEAANEDEFEAKKNDFEKFVKDEMNAYIATNSKLSLDVLAKLMQTFYQANYRAMEEGRVKKRSGRSLILRI